MFEPSTARAMKEQTAASGRAGRVWAFFDVDNTLIPGCAIEVRFARFLWRRGVLPTSAFLRSAWHLLKHVPPLSLHPLRQRKLYLEAQRPSVIEPLAEEFIRSDVRPRLSQSGLTTLRRHQDAGQCVVLLTGSPEFLIRPLAGDLGVTHICAAKPERQGDHYTGRLVDPLPYGPAKRQLMEGLAKQHGVTLAESYAYGDSPGDVESLQAVGYPQVVNPIRGMARIAKRHGWPIVKWE
jgi:HAD superfamily hydrolase (TIGR01490 family)